MVHAWGRSLSLPRDAALPATSAPAVCAATQARATIAECRACTHMFTVHVPGMHEAPCAHVVGVKVGLRVRPPADNRRDHERILRLENRRPLAGLQAPLAGLPLIKTKKQPVQNQVPQVGFGHPVTSLPMNLGLAVRTSHVVVRHVHVHLFVRKQVPQFGFGHPVTSLPVNPGLAVRTLHRHMPCRIARKHAIAIAMHHHNGT